MATETCDLFQLKNTYAGQSIRMHVRTARPLLCAEEEARPQLEWRERLWAACVTHWTALLLASTTVLLFTKSFILSNIYTELPLTFNTAARLTPAN